MSTLAHTRAGVAALVLAWAMAFGAGTAAAQTAAVSAAAEVPVEVTARLGADEVLLGEPFMLFITAVHERDVEVNLPTALPLGSDLELAGRASERRAAPDGRLVREFALELIAWELGTRPIPALPVTYAIAGSVHSAHTEPLEIRVVSLVAPGQGEPMGTTSQGTEALRDIIGPFAALRRDRTLMAVYAGAVAGAAVLLGVLGVMLWRIRGRRKRQATSTQAVARPTPASALRQELQALEGKLGRGEIAHKQAFIELSAAMRGYLGALYHVPALDWTTAEVLAYAPAMLAALSPERAAAVSERLGAWLSRCDLVKYAGAAPSAEEMRAHLAEAHQLANALQAQEQDLG